MIGWKCRFVSGLAAVMAVAGCDKAPEWPPHVPIPLTDEARALADNANVQYSVMELEQHEDVAGGINEFGAHLYNVKALRVSGRIVSKSGSVEKTAVFGGADVVFQDPSFEKAHCEDATQCAAGQWALCLKSGQLLVESEKLLAAPQKAIYRAGGPAEDIYLRNEFGFQALTEKLGVVEIDPGQAHQVCLVATQGGTPSLTIAPLGTRVVIEGKKIERRIDGWYFGTVKMKLAAEM